MKDTNKEGANIELENALDKYDMDGDGWYAIRKALSQAKEEGRREAINRVVVDIDTRLDELRPFERHLGTPTVHVLAELSAIKQRLLDIKA